MKHAATANVKTHVDPQRKIRAVPVRTPAAPTASASQVSVGSHCAANAPRSRSRSQYRSQHSSGQAHTVEKHDSHSSDGVHFTGKAASNDPQSSASSHCAADEPRVCCAPSRRPLVVCTFWHSYSSASSPARLLVAAFLSGEKVSHFCQPCMPLTCL